MLALRGRVRQWDREPALPVVLPFRKLSKLQARFDPRGADMKSYRDTLTLNVPKRMAFINITPQVEAAVAKSGVREGLALINGTYIALHTTPHRPSGGR
ncbi:MAG: hypothetical protein GX575_29245 [Candidatus Anammoximicrobium sp.]|nr:hypothetical protein [Candidatus Anammoximicrobium sp.]